MINYLFIFFLVIFLVNSNHVIKCKIKCYAPNTSSTSCGETLEFETLLDNIKKGECLFKETTILKKVEFLVHIQDMNIPKIHTSHSIIKSKT